MWIHQQANWPNFTWDPDVIATKLALVRYKQGHLIGQMDHLGFNLKQEATLTIITSDIIKSSAIEGENLNPDDVRSSIARKLGIDVGGLRPPNRDVEGIVELMLDATQNYLSPLSKERLCNWHAALFPTGRSGLHRITVGNWRTEENGPMQVISGPIGRETIHFEAPNSLLIDGFMTDFITWFEACTTIDPILKAGIAHFWFITIHPFEDGNGRIARAIADMSLARADAIPFRFYSLSTQIELEKKKYYTQLEHQQRSSVDITNWLHWFLDCLEKALISADKTLGRVLGKAQLWSKLNENPVNDRQRLVINRMTETDFIGYINTSKYAKLAKCSNDTALRDIVDLKNRGVLTQNPGSGRSTSYTLADFDTTL